MAVSPRGLARGAFGPAADIDARAIAGLHFRIHPAQNHRTTVGRDELAILRAAGGTRRTDIVLTAGTALEVQFLKLRAVGEIHHHAPARPAIDHHRLAALAAR